MTESVQTIKQRFGIIGDNPRLNRALEKAIQVAPTDISVLVTGESGVGKESIPKIIHHLSHRKHGKYIAVNCGAIPEGTIDSELFGHEKGSFTGAASARAGYFEVADGGTIFLDEVGELPLTTQVRLLRVLENGEFIRVGSSEVKKTNVRIVAATNMNMQEAVQNEKFREDLYYRLSTVEIHLPPLRDRKGDIHLLFRKFAADFAQKYKMPVIRLEENAVGLLENYHWGGNIRQLRNVAEQLSILETQRNIGPDRLREYLPVNNRLPALAENKSESGFSSEREILYKVLFDMKSDLNDLKKLTLKLIESDDANEVKEENRQLISKIYGNPDLMEEDDADVVESLEPMKLIPLSNKTSAHNDPYDFAEEIEEEETLSLQEKEQELIRKALERNNGKRKLAAKELGISERTLYRKIKQLDL